MSSPPRPSWLTLDALVDYPRPGTNGPTQFSFSPDGLLTFLWSDRGDTVRDLWALDLETGERQVLVRAADLGTLEGELPQEETLRRERQRVREGGVTQYQWAKDADRLLAPFNGQLYVTDGQGPQPEGEALHPGPLGDRGPGVTGRHSGGRVGRVAASEEAAVDARLTPDGQRIVFARAKELWVADLESGDVTRLTFDSGENVSNGVAEFIAQEEMGRASGFWVSPDGGRVAYAQVDEGDVPAYPIVHQAQEWRVEHHRYPFAGAANARVRLGIVGIDDGRTRWLELDAERDEYLARVDWQGDERLLVQVESRDQKRLELRAYPVSESPGVPPAAGQRPAPPARTLLVEESQTWINLHHDLRVLADGSFVWASERTGFKHLSLYDRDGGLVRVLTAGLWPVDGVVHLDESRRRVYFTAGRETPLERHLYAVSLDGGEVVRLTGQPGFHSATFSRDGARYVHVWESLTQPPKSVVHGVEDGQDMVVHDAGSLEEVAPGLRPPQLIELEAANGTRLYGAIYYPEGRGQGLGARGQEPEGWTALNLRPPPPDPRLPTVVSVYGGPHAQMVTNTWGLTVDLRAQYLASREFVVFKLDNRGSARRGLAFEGTLNRRMGTVEVEDQVAGVRWLVAQGIADPHRVGIYGWSYGGYLAALCLLKAGEVFRAAVAGAPVADWDGYDTHWTERYMGTPAENPDGYREASLLTHAHRLQRKLLIAHGLVDENVHFRHTARFIAALEQAEKAFDLLLLPDERHGLRPTAQNRAVRRHLEERLTRFFTENLQALESGAAPHFAPSESASQN